MASDKQSSSSNRSAEAPVVQITDLRKSFGETTVLDGVSINVRRGEVCTLIGPSGSGKTTLLRCINALSPIDSGEVRVDGKLVTNGFVLGQKKPNQRELSRIRSNIGFVFQLFNLLPDMTYSICGPMMCQISSQLSRPPKPRTPGCRSGPIVRL